MRQRHGGPKIINWHRPLAPGKLKRKYLRFRDAELSEDHLYDPDDLVEIVGWKQYKEDYLWWPYDPFDTIDFAYCEAISTLQRPSSGDDLRVQLLDMGFRDSLEVQDVRIKSLPRAPIPHIEAKLFAHIQYLFKEGKFSHEMSQKCASDADIKVIKEIFEGSEGATQSEYLNYIIFSPFWIRSPKGFRAKGKAVRSELLTYLFEYHPVPAGIRSAWNVSGPRDQHFKWILFYLILAQGGSLRKFSKYVNWNIPKRFTHCLYKVDKYKSILRTVIHAYILSIGGSRKELIRLTRNEAYVLDPTISIEWPKSAFGKFWKGTVLWLIKYREHLADDEVDLVLAWAMHRFLEARRNRETFQLTGRSPERALGLSIEYHQGRTTSMGSYIWNKKYSDWEYSDKNEDLWLVIELTSGKALLEEGAALQHCVWSYGYRCMTGESAILSLRKNSGRQLTIEVSPKSDGIVQVRGKQNRSMNEYEKHIVNLWQHEALNKSIKA